ncbi:hypothetical protein COV82_04280 [Candidatus Peregrinibacteria bacterium CG11_big_fil_rev_8_21_14_0_20_46_8]|nr:MAG: hypothetical protein COV82_04280 [Candidatus Peregrinibacteria bacterium CG11_big_fil_rev_8_21_14_0_20_46_8]
MVKSFLKLLLIPLAFLLLPSSTLAAIDLPPPSGYVNDFAGVLEAKERETFESLLVEFERETTNEIVVAIVPNLGGLDRFTYSQELFTQWGIGKADRNNGVLFLIAIEDREAFINVGKGLEGVLPDGFVGTLLREEVFPAFKQGGYAVGISNGIARMMEISRGEFTADEYESQYASGPSGPIESLLGIIFQFGIFFFIFFTHLLGRTKSWWLGGVLGALFGAIIGWFLFPGLFFLLSSFGLGMAGTAFDYVVSKNYGKKGRSGIWWIGGGGRGGFGGGGGFGGFGGGMSGGGGAGGRW